MADMAELSDFLSADEWGSVLSYIKSDDLVDNDECDEAKVNDLEDRCSHLEAILRIKKQVNSSNVFSATFKWVPKDYYDRPISARAVILNSSEHRLCKSMVMENTAWQDQGEGSFNPKYCLVMVQYNAKFNSEKLASVIHKLGNGKASKKAYHFRLAPEEIAIKLSGFRHNAVSPFGILEPSSITLIAARAIFDTNDEPSFIWMGGGHPDLKLGCSTYHFKQALKPIIADISEPR